ncbi:MAG: tetratricopeptide repeat protein [Saprospiraceae bacterium]|nr:tetratricopeptide repeat protein [Saprospiraceae bacterium]
MQATRVIFKGKFDFGSPETVSRIVRLLEPRILNLYKSDFPWKLEELLPEGAEKVIIRPESMHLTDRTWKHAIDGLEFMAQFALCGEVMAFQLGATKKPGVVVRPISEKAAVILYIHAMESDDMGNRRDLLNQAIDKYPAHCDALVARAQLEMDTDQLQEALVDLDRALARDAEHSGALLAYARCKYSLGESKEALAVLAKTMKYSMPLEDIHWRARHLKAVIYQANEEYALAVKELKALLTRMDTRPKLLADVKKEIRNAYSFCQEQLGESGTFTNDASPKPKQPRLAKATA